ncbi:LPP20 family lipoprotein [Helicobacter cetorum]|uniref:LPP20 family lipoprotein n=1 Tax=Helicobacter cetorum TaxID=138563 RepID=UPI000CF1C368|nr:LPP20 family lipoprotein [Helicobacter cetorum]
MKTAMLILSRTCATCLLGAILSSAMQAKEYDKAPKWYMHYKQDNAYFYGNGEGRDRESSKQKALNDLASSILVHVKSKTTLSTKLENNHITTKNAQNIELNTDSLALFNAEVVRQGMSKNGLYYTILKLNKQKFLNDLERRYLALRAQLAPLLPKHCQGVFLKEASKMQKIFEKLEPMQSILSAFDKAVSPLERYQKVYLDNTPKPKVRLSFSNGVDEEIKEAIYSSYMRLMQESNEPHLYSLQTTIYTQNGGDYIGVNLVVKDCQDKVILTKNLQVEQDNRGDAIEAIKAEVFKSLRDYRNSDGQGNSDIDSKDNAIEF